SPNCFARLQNSGNGTFLYGQRQTDCLSLPALAELRVAAATAEVENTGASVAHAGSVAARASRCRAARRPKLRGSSGIGRPRFASSRPLADEANITGAT